MKFDTLRDGANGVLLAEECKDELRYDGIDWHYFTGQRWETCTFGPPLALGYKVANRLQAMMASEDNSWTESEFGPPNKDRLSAQFNRIQTRVGVESCLAFAREHPLLHASPSDWDQKPFLLNCGNGTLNLETGRLQAPHPNDLLTLITPTNYDPDAKCPIWDTFLAEFCGGDADKIEFLDRWLGYCLTGSNPQQCFLFMQGSGDNGKSTLLDVFATAIGEYADACAAHSFRMKRDGTDLRDDVVRMQGRRFFQVPESGERFSFDMGMMKQLTGSDPVVARRLYRGNQTFRVSAKFVFHGNDWPELPSLDKGWERRLLLFNCTASFSDRKDVDFKAKLLAEKEGILARAVRGWSRFQEQTAGGKPLWVPDVLLRLKRAYLKENNDIYAFLHECCTIGDDLRQQARPLYQAYQQWCRSLAFTAVSERSFAKQVPRLGFEKVDHGGTKFYRNIELRREVRESLERVNGLPSPSEALSW